MKPVFMVLKMTPFQHQLQKKLGPVQQEELFQVLPTPLTESVRQN